MADGTMIGRGRVPTKVAISSAQVARSGPALWELAGPHDGCGSSVTTAGSGRWSASGPTRPRHAADVQHEAGPPSWFETGLSLHARTPGSIIAGAGKREPANAPCKPGSDLR